MKKIGLYLSTGLLLLVVAGCGPSAEEIAGTEQALDATAAAKSTGTARVELTSQAATQMMETELAETAAAATSTQAALDEKATQEANRQATAYAGTEVVKARATESASDIFQVVEALYDEGHLYSKDGYYQKFDDLEYSWAQMYWYRLFPIQDSEAKDFVLMMDLAWASGDKYTELDVAGCGVAFRVDEDYGSYYSFLLTLDGNISFLSKTPSKFAFLSKECWDKVDYMEDSTKIILVVQDNTFKVFNEALEQKDLRVGNALTEGTLALSLSSGNNASFGTRCTFENVDMWHLTSD